MRLSLKATFCLCILSLAGTAMATPGRDQIEAWFSGSTDIAIRGDFIRAIVEMNGGVISDVSKGEQKFSDIGMSHEYYPFFAEAHQEKWLWGSTDCDVGKDCRAAPEQTLKLRDMAIILTQTFALEATNKAPTFTNNPWGAWGSMNIQILADHCILDATTDGKIMAHDPPTKSEVVDILLKVDQQPLMYGKDCQFSSTNNVSAQTAQSSRSSASVMVTSSKADDKFTDVSASHQNTQAITYVRENGIVSGFPDGTYRPNQAINRAEFTKIVIGALFPKNRIDKCGSTYFNDGDRTAWYNIYICTAKDEHIIDGYPDGTFRPAATINFAEAAKIISGGFRLVTEGQESTPWYRKYIESLAARHSIPTDIISFEQPITRGQMAEMIYRLHAKDETGTSKTYEQIAGIPSSDVANRVSGRNIAKVPSSWKRYENSEGNFSLAFPPDWVGFSGYDGSKISFTKIEVNQGGYGEPEGDGDLFVQMYSEETANKGNSRTWYEFLMTFTLSGRTYEEVRKVDYGEYTYYELRLRDGEKAVGKFYYLFEKQDMIVALGFEEKNDTIETIVSSFTF